MLEAVTAEDVKDYERVISLIDVLRTVTELSDEERIKIDALLDVLRVRHGDQMSEFLDEARRERLLACGNDAERLQALKDMFTNMFSSNHPKK